MNIMKVLPTSIFDIHDVQNNTMINASEIKAGSTLSIHNAG